MDWVGIAFSMCLVAMLTASVTLVVVHRQKISESFAKKRDRAVKTAGKPIVAGKKLSSYAPSVSSTAQNTDKWERKFKLLHAMVPESRREDIIRYAMSKYNLDRSRAVRKIVEDWQSEDSVRS